MKHVSARLCALAAAVLLTSSPSFADDRSRHAEPQKGNRHGQAQEDRSEDRREGRNDDRHDDRHWGQRDARQFDQREGRWNERSHYYNARGPRFYRGGTIPREYRLHAYTVNYHEHRLQRPPPGQRWVQVGADYVLIAIATGVIAHIILSQ